jgi:hypothetical protein
MNISVKFRPQPIKGLNKSDVERHIHGIPTFSSQGNFVQSYCKEFAIVVNYVKFNRKTKQTRNAFQDKTSSTVVRQKHWIGYVYRIPISFLIASKLKVKQNCRNFQVVSK